MITINSIAPCGMNCGICMAQMRDKNVCPGCNSKSETRAKACSRCTIFNCSHRLENKIKFCFECIKYPCRRLKDLDKRYKTRYGMSMLENLQNIKKSGIREFVRNEKERWKCPDCGSYMCVHRKNCLVCGGERKFKIYLNN